LKILVTGASGFLGKNYLLASSVTDSISAIYNNSSDFISFLSEKNLSHVTPIKMNMSLPSDFQNEFLLDTYDLCVFFAANGDPAFSAIEPLIDLNSNTASLINLFSKVSVKKLIFFSSGAVYDGLTGPVKPGVSLHPHLPYAISKLASEYYIDFFNRKKVIGEYSIVRFFGAYGSFEPKRKIYSKLVTQFGIEGNPNFSLKGDGKNYVDAMYIDDTIRAINLLENLSGNQTLDLYSGARISLTDLAQTAAKVFKINSKIDYFGTVPEYIEFYSVDNFMSEKLNFKPEISLEEGLVSLYNYLVENKKDLK